MNDSKETLFMIEIEPTGGAVRPEMAPEKFMNATRETLNQVAAVVENSCAAFIARIADLEAKPSEIGIEFGVDAGGEAGIPFVTKGSVGANFKISLIWTWTK